jgi:hypothetical protein
MARYNDLGTVMQRYTCSAPRGAPSRGRGAMTG